jgi:asparagine synthase (glutamine-hydrolysing)
MCGILGVVAARGNRPSVNRGQFEAMRDSMTARGPDDSGLLMRENVAFGHRLLAIRDRDGGSQPALSPDGNLALVYNGELYNDDELRRELRNLGHTFRTRCDTETLVTAWLEWGSQCLERLRGMFAFAVYDFATHTLSLVRDRFGIKPLFFTSANQEVSFASSVSALLIHPQISRDPDWSAMSHYLSTFRTTLGHQTMFRGIRQLRPAEVLSWELRTDQVRIDRYWDFPQEEQNSFDIDIESAADRFEALLQDATRSRLVSDVPIGMFLSGGVDSSLLATAVAESRSGNLLGSCGSGVNDNVISNEASNGSDDLSFAAKCAAHSGFDFDSVRVTADGYQAAWESMIDHSGLPLSTPNDVILFRLAERMKQSVGVVLGGEGADELLCGYALPHWGIEDFRLAGLSLAGRWPGTSASERVFLRSLNETYGRTEFLGPVDHYFSANSLIPLAVKPGLLNEDIFSGAGSDEPMFQFYAQEFREAAESSADGREQLLHRQAIVLHRLNLENLLARLDRSTMQASLEARVPYTDHHLVEFAFSLPMSMRIDIAPNEESPFLAASMLDRRGTLRSKRLIRQVAARRLPAELANRRKASFPTPVRQWLSGPWQNWARDRLLNSEFARQIFRREALVELTSNVAMAGMWLWPMLNLAMWGDSVL